MKFFISLIVFIVSMFVWNSSAEASHQKEEAIYLSLAEAIQKALNNNFEIELARLGKRIGATHLPLQKAIFEPHLKAEEHLIGDRGIDAKPFLGLAKRFPTGTTASLTLIDMENENSALGVPMLPPSPVINSTLELSIAQPLLKNRGGIMERGSVELARLSIENIDSASHDVIEGAIAATEKAYWDLVLAYEILRIREDMLKWAEELVDLNKELIKIGLVERIDLLTSETNLYLRQGELLLAENGFQSAVNRLKLLMNTPVFNDNIVPTEELVMEDEEINPDAKLQEAFVHRRDYQRARTDIQASDLQLKIKASSRLPQVDLIGSLEWQEIDTRPGGIFEDSPDYFLGVELSFPIGGGKAQSEYERALLEKEQALVNLEMIERIIITEVDERVRAVEVSRKQTRQHLRIQELQRLQLEEEMRKFKHGRSRSDVLVRFREALLKTEMATIGSLVSYRKSWADLRQTQNTLLSKWQIANGK